MRAEHHDGRNDTITLQVTVTDGDGGYGVNSGDGEHRGRWLFNDAPRRLERGDDGRGQHPRGMGPAARDAGHAAL